MVLTFNGPLESGIRSVALLGAAYPTAYDIGQLTALDYLLLRTAELDGPDSLHPPSPIQSPDATVRRKVVQDGIDLMASRDLIERLPSSAGIVYSATDTAVPFLEALGGPYLSRLKERADWIVNYFEGQPVDAVSRTVRQIFDKWVIEFQSVERSLGSRQ
jgi:hypothetical protein